ncbi:hypothetical protein ACMBCN_00995 [Candidatus Liberibacter asiaticus]
MRETGCGGYQSSVLKSSQTSAVKNFFQPLLFGCSIFGRKII